MIDELKNEIILSGGTIIFEKDNIIVASEISEEEYRALLNNPNIEKVDVLPLKRYGYDPESYQNMIEEGHWIY